MIGEFGNASPNPLSMNAPSTSAPVERAPIKTKITLRAPTPPTPFYTMKPSLPPPSQLLGSMDLLRVYDLSGSYQKFCSPEGTKRIAKEDLSSFLPHLYGDFNWQKGQEISWVKMLIEKPPITGKEIAPLNASAMASFKLQPGIVDEPYRSLFDTSYELVKEGNGVQQKIVKKEKRKLKMSIDPLDEDCIDNWAMDGAAPDMGSDDEGGTKKKKKKSDKDREERKERKKEKREKKEKKSKRERED
ncbi:hypothetical protein PMAYCL1PPCAC_12102, partial [Pristionchus mayeri]